MIKTKLFLLASIAFCILVMPSDTHAASDFNAGRIIDDSIFTNKSSMSPSSIQSFLNSKVSNCDTWGEQPSEFGGGTRRQWGEARGLNPPYTCLKDYSENGKSASQIIYDVSQEFTINPQVLIVLLQKEQGLVTDTWPTSTQYKTATGYGCPDTAPCDSQYYGLTNQLTWAARMFRAILNNSPTWYTPYVLGNNYIQYNPTASCGGSNVNIENRSTQALYNYTPYQPNAGALAAGWGTAQCGAYGNRNFYLYFTSWFGSTSATPTYTWQSAGQLVTIGSETTSTNTINLNPGTIAKATVKATNTSNRTWYQYNTTLGTSREKDRISAFTSTDWLMNNRPALLKEPSVAPGEVGTFEFTVTAPNKLMSSREYFNILTEGVSWHQDIGYYYDVNVVQPSGEYYNVNYQSQDLYTDSARTKNITSSYNNVIAGSTLYGKVRFVNSGNNAITNTFGMLATANPRDRISTFKDASWLSENRIAAISDTSVQPGQSGTVLFSLKTPQALGWQTETFGMVAEGKSWMDLDKFKFTVNVNAIPRYVFSTHDHLAPNNQLMASSLTHRLILQPDGNLVLYKNDTPLWSTNTVGAKNAQLIMQADGNLVLYAEGSRPVWHSGTVGNQQTLLVLQNDGNLVIYNQNNVPRWSSGTNGR